MHHHSCFPTGGDGGDGSVDTGAIIGGVVAVIFIVAVTVIVLTFILRRKQSKEIVLA